MAEIYPQAEPYDRGFLEAGDGNRVYWEVSGNPGGIPAVFLHGGPGSGCNSGMSRYLDPHAYRVVLFDQRNCGRSTPHASDPQTDLSANTTEHLLADIELLRQTLHIDRWLVFGGSWGSTLALAYAERHPERVTGLILVSVTTTSPWEIEWITRGLGRFFPEQWERFRDGVPPQQRDGNLAEAYRTLLEDPDPEVRQKAAIDWCTWELALIAAVPGHKPSTRFENPDFRQAFARLVTHYWSRDAWLEDGVLLRNARALKGIPGVMIHGRLDLGCPLVIPWELAKAWPKSELVIVDSAGHAASDPGMTEAVLAATNSFAARR